MSTHSFIVSNYYCKYHLRIYIVIFDNITPIWKEKVKSPPRGEEN